MWDVRKRIPWLIVFYSTRHRSTRPPIETLAISTVPFRRNEITADLDTVVNATCSEFPKSTIESLRYPGLKRHETFQSVTSAISSMDSGKIRWRASARLSSRDDQAGDGAFWEDVSLVVRLGFALMLHYTHPTVDIRR